MSSCSRLLAKLTNTNLIVHGLDNIPKNNEPYIVVSNHSSFLDSYVLVAVLPNTYRFIAKKELAQRFITRKPLENKRHVGACNVAKRFYKCTYGATR